MKVFISWSGDRSRGVAAALDEWLPQVIQALDTWISPRIDKGIPWGREIGERLENTEFGIVCVTATNQDSPWLNYEAGALSKPLKSSHVATVLLDIEPGDVRPPLGSFQSTRLIDKEDVRKLSHTLNAALGQRALPDKRLDDGFERCWHELRARLEAEGG